MNWTPDIIKCATWTAVVMHISVILCLLQNAKKVKHPNENHNESWQAYNTTFKHDS